MTSNFEKDLRSEVNSFVKDTPHMTLNKVCVAIGYTNRDKFRAYFIDGKGQIYSGTIAKIKTFIQNYKG